MTTIPDTYQPTSWHAAAACADEDPDLFHLPGDGIHDQDADTRHAAQIADAKAICASCPVTAECLTAALATPTTQDRWAIAGATTPRQRARERRRRARRLAPGVPDDRTGGVS